MFTEDWSISKFVQKELILFIKPVLSSWAISFKVVIISKV